MQTQLASTLTTPQRLHKWKLSCILYSLH